MLLQAAAGQELLQDTYQRIERQQLYCVYEPPSDRVHWEVQMEPDGAHDDRMAGAVVATRHDVGSSETVEPVRVGMRVTRWITTAAHATDLYHWIPGSRAAYE